MAVAKRVRKSVTSGQIQSRRSEDDDFDAEEKKQGSSSSSSSYPSSSVVGRPTSRKNPKYDWEMIKRQYVEGVNTGTDEKSLRLPTLKELSDEYGAPYTRVRERSAKERWTERRAEYQIVATRERQKKRVKKMAENAVEFDANAYKVASTGMAMIYTRLAEIAAQVNASRALRADALERQKNGEPVERYELYSAVNYREMEGLASAASRFQEVGMKSLGTDVQRHEISGPDGGPIEATTTSIIQELNRDDPERLAMLVAAMKESGLYTGDDENVIDGELIEETETTTTATTEVARRE